MEMLLKADQSYMEWAKKEHKRLQHQIIKFLVSELWQKLVSLIALINGNL
jgi:hypothetical protein